MVDTNVIDESRLDDMPFVQNIIKMEGGRQNCHISGNLGDILTELKHGSKMQTAQSTQSACMPDRCTQCDEGKLLNEAFKKREASLLARVSDTINALYEKITKRAAVTEDKNLELQNLPTTTQMQEFVSNVMSATMNKDLRLLNLSIKKLLLEERI